jgi:hypothetical protein
VIDLTPETHRHKWEIKLWQFGGFATYTNIWCAECHYIAQWYDVVDVMNAEPDLRQQVASLTGRLENVVAVGFDRDGYHDDAEGLRRTIDKMVRIARGEADPAA